MVLLMAPSQYSWHNRQPQRDYHICSVTGNICIADVKAQGTWKLLDELEDPELRSLASRLYTYNHPAQSCI